MRVPLEIVFKVPAAGDSITCHEHYGDDGFGDSSPESSFHIASWWVEGNGACDCNRRLACNRATGETAEAHCGHDILLTSLTRLDTGQVIATYDDYAPGVALDDAQQAKPV